MTKYKKLPPSEHHKHKLTLMAETTEPFRCNGCREYGHHLRYACKDRSCGGQFHLHEACAQEFGKRYQDPFKRHGFVFRGSLPSTRVDALCHACGGNVNGYAYVREGGMSSILKIQRPIVLHPCCAALPAVIEAADGVKLQLRRKLSSPCCKCGQVKLGGSRHTWGYASASAGKKGAAIQIHVACANKLFREEYEKALLQRQRAARFMARVTRLLNAAAAGGGEPSNKAESTRTEEAAGSVLLPGELSISVPAKASSKVDRAMIFQAVWWAVCTVGAVVTGNPISISQLLLQLFTPNAALTG